MEAIHATTALTSEKEAPVSIAKKAESAPESVWIL
jgi:hypothetical protein